MGHTRPKGDLLLSLFPQFLPSGSPKRSVGWQVSAAAPTTLSFRAIRGRDSGEDVRRNLLLLMINAGTHGRCQDTSPHLRNPALYLNSASSPLSL
jgi:hypothetical protein